MMRVLPGLVALLVVLSACGGGGDQGRIEFEISLQGLPDLGSPGGLYQGWAVVDGVPRTTGRFRIDGSQTPNLVVRFDFGRVFGTVDSARFGPANTALGEDFPFIQDATEFFITIESEVGLPAPDRNVILRGTFQGDQAILTVAEALEDPGFGSILNATAQATTLNASVNGGDPTRGVWFTSQPQPNVMPGIVGIPFASGNWDYEGWVTDGTQSFSLGKFRDASGRDMDDQASPLRGPDAVGLIVPGQDFINPATINAATQLDLTSGDWRAEITIEPDFDNDLGPFPFRVLAADIPADAVDPMTGVAILQVDLDVPMDARPTIDAILSPAGLDCIASDLADLGGEQRGIYGLIATLPTGDIEVAQFRIDAALGQALSPDGTIVYGTSDVFSFTPGNTDPSILAQLAMAESLTLVISPSPLDEPSAQFRPLLSGPFENDPGLMLPVAEMRVENAIADFAMVSGSFVTVTPTDNLDNPMVNDNQGIWFRLLAFPVSSLQLPMLPDSWLYEGWVVNTVTGARFSTGRFRDPRFADLDALTWPGRGPNSAGFDLPGQDFVTDAPGTAVPSIDLTQGWTLRVTIEPFPDNSLEPFFLGLFEGLIPSTPLTPFPLSNLLAAPPPGVVTPSGVVSFEE